MWIFVTALKWSWVHLSWISRLFVCRINYCWWEDSSWEMKAVKCCRQGSLVSKRFAFIVRFYLFWVIWNFSFPPFHYLVGGDNSACILGRLRRLHVKIYAASASPRKMLEMQTLRPLPDLLNQNSHWRQGGVASVLKSVISTEIDKH